MNLNKISERIYYLERDDEKGFPAIGFVQGEVFTLMVDAGANASHAEIFLKKIGEAKLHEPIFTVLTHHHWEHSFGLSSLETISVACKACAKKLEEFANANWNEEYLKEAVQKNLIPVSCVDHFKAAYPNFEDIEIFEPDMIFEGEMVIDLGGCKAIVKHIPSSHTRDCVAVYIPEEKVIFLGDGANQAHIGKNLADDEEELTALQKYIRNLDVETCICSHAEPMSKEKLLAELAERIVFFR